VLFSPELRFRSNKKDESPVGWLKAKSPGLTADSRSLLSGLAQREGKVPPCWAAKDCHHNLPGPLYRSYLTVGTGYCRRVARHVTGRQSLEQRALKFNFCLGITNHFHMVDSIYNVNLESLSLASSGKTRTRCRTRHIQSSAELLFRMQMVDGVPTQTRCPVCGCLPAVHHNSPRERRKSYDSVEKTHPGLANVQQ
jgi:hypothetical protein